jgi:hypothetical protein
MQTSSLIIITLCVAATLTLSAVTKKIIKHYDSDRPDNQEQPKDFQPKSENVSQ